MDKIEKKIEEYIKTQTDQLLDDNIIFYDDKEDEYYTEFSRYIDPSEMILEILFDEDDPLPFVTFFEDKIETDKEAMRELQQLIKTTRDGKYYIVARKSEGTGEDALDSIWGIYPTKEAAGIILDDLDDNAYEIWGYYK